MRYDDVKTDLRAAYDAGADAREVMDDAPWKRSERARFAAHLRPGAALLEIGAGHGVSGRHFADAGFAVTCTDLSPALVAHCRAKGLDARVMDFARLDFPDAAFDAVWGMNCLLHVPKADLPAVLAGIARVLAPGGLFYWGQYGGEDSEGVWESDAYEPKRFFSFFTADRIEALAQEHFALVEAARIPVAGTIGEYQGLVLRNR
ncbi:class I SAM-dependent methyltransferase [Glycomyces terrestris]|uniref:Class I SAM-dependent methyltransferase n=1 Tax=Glycomyces terrestris TaxID=2493553 RepID=A0A426UWC2_9ACTN|nr:class I SAM-dependent methyltransferase [Glycomyces terrestris]RRR98627.1 class I SAM-dependent methyltransferase [Glycomyces terrestris]